MVLILGAKFNNSTLIKGTEYLASFHRRGIVKTVFLKLKYLRHLFNLAVKQFVDSKVTDQHIPSTDTTTHPIRVIIPFKDQAPVPGKPISANRGLNPFNPGIKVILRLVSVPESTISAIQGIN